jgi:hypothetical protein
MFSVTARFLPEHRKPRLGTAVRRRDSAEGTRIRRSRTPPRLRDESGRAYSPASDSRAIRRRRTSSYGISCTRPESTSSRRRLISSAQACSTPLSDGDGSRLSISESAIAARASGGRARAFFRMLEASSVTAVFYTVARQGVVSVQIPVDELRHGSDMVSLSQDGRSKSGGFSWFRRLHPLTLFQ